MQYSRPDEARLRGTVRSNASSIQGVPASFPEAYNRTSASPSTLTKSQVEPMQVAENKESVSQVDMHLYDDAQRGITLQTLLRQTGLGIKIRFLLALTLIAIFPALILVTLLGDPSGQEQDATLRQGLLLQGQAQANAINLSVASRTLAISRISTLVPFSQITTGDPAIIEQASLSLQGAQQADPASLEWIILRQDGTILISGDTSHNIIGQQLGQTKFVASTSALTALVHQAATTKNTISLLNNDTHVTGGWLALARSLPQQSASSPLILLAVFPVRQLIQVSMSTNGGVPGLAGMLLDQQGRIVASTTKLVNGQALFTPAPTTIQALATSTQGHVSSFSDPLTGTTDVGASASVPALQGQYVVLAPQGTLLSPSMRTFFAGRNTPLLILAVLVAVVLVATWVALPIVRPIRRATREIGTTTEEVRKLADSARRIAKEHATGTMILSGASRRLSGRRQTIIRDGQAIARISTTLAPRVQWLIKASQSTSNRQMLEVAQSMYQGLQQIYNLGNSIADGLEKDNTLTQLDGAMESAREISTQFEGAGVELERDAEQLELAARTLL